MNIDLITQIAANFEKKSPVIIIMQYVNRPAARSIRGRRGLFNYVFEKKQW